MSSADPIMTKSANSSWTISDMGTDSILPFCALFQEVFNKSLSTEMWEWKYGEGRGGGMLAWRGQQLVSAYASVGREILFKGVPANAVQICDVMVKQDQRGVLTRKGPFYQTASAFPEKYVGFGKKYLLGFGFPNKRHMMLAKKLGLYEEVGQLLEYRWGALKTLPSPIFKVRPLGQPDQKTIGKIDELWQRMSRAFDEKLIGLRNWLYLDHRYKKHPENSYRIHTVTHRITGKLVGLMVLKRDKKRMQLMDLVAEPSMFSQIIHQARRATYSSGAEELYLWLSDIDIPLPFGHGTPLDIHIPTSIWTDGPSPESIQNLWWLTAGDMDSR